MNPLFKKVKGVTSEACVSIILNTHRTHPDSEKDPILLGNLVKQAKERLYNDYEKRFVWPIEERLDALVASIDHNYNLDSLVIFVNEEMAEYIRLSAPVVDRVVIDQTFATRDLIRASHEEGSYYVLQLSRDQARLIEAYNDRVQREVLGEFPLSNPLQASNAEQASHSKGTDNLIEEFFNQVDKAYQDATGDNPMPLILVTETRNYDYYLAVADKKDLIIGHINRMPDQEDPAKVVASAWGEVQQLFARRQAERIEELQVAVGQHRFLTDYNEIWQALHQGRGKTLFVKKGFFQPAVITGDQILLVDSQEADKKEVIDDLIDEMIEVNLSMGGDVVFIKNEDLKDFQNLSLVTRY